MIIIDEIDYVNSTVPRRPPPPAPAVGAARPVRHALRDGPDLRAGGLPLPPRGQARAAPLRELPRANRDHHGVLRPAGPRRGQPRRGRSVAGAPGPAARAGRAEPA